MRRDGLSRRQLLSAASVGFATGLAGCSAPFAGRVGRGGTASYAGRVVDLDATPVADATVEALVAGDPLASTTTDADGAFELSAAARPVWLRVRHEAYKPEVRAFAPGTGYRVPLTPADGVVSFAFGGDVMFGRRFNAPNEDSLEPQARIYPGSRRADHDAILQYVAPLFRAADVGSVNLETPLTTSAWRHPTKQYSFVSHPVAAPALAAAGVDNAALGNNHSFDALTPGLTDTLDAVDRAGLAHSGAGESSEAAWEPAVVDRGGLRTAFVSATTVTGSNYDVDWSADTDDPASYTVTRGNRTLTVDAGAGAAAATPERIDRAVSAARETADLVVVQIHGGAEYRRTPTDSVVAATDAAVAAGADMVVNHHPHVTGGIERRDGTLVAWTLGNLVFDQELWSTLRSYTLQVHATAEGVLRAYTQPIALSGYVPMATTGPTSRRQGWEAAGLSDESMRLLGRGRRLEHSPFVDAVSRAGRRRQPVRGDGDIYTRTAGWVEDASSADGAVRLGAERLFTGGFGDPTVDGDDTGGVLWRFGSSPETRANAAQGGTIELVSRPENSRRTVLTPGSRLPAEGDEYGLSIRYRHPSGEGASLLVAWYNAASGPSIESRNVDLPGTDGWERTELSATRPEQATYVNLFLFVSPPDGGRDRRVEIDDLRLIEWAPSERTGGREFDHVRVDGEAELSLCGRAYPPADWTPLGEE